jgi:hypothetical protein
VLINWGRNCKINFAWQRNICNPVKNKNPVLKLQNKFKAYNFFWVNFSTETKSARKKNKIWAGGLLPFLPYHKFIKIPSADFYVIIKSYLIIPLTDLNTKCSCQHLGDCDPKFLQAEIQKSVCDQFGVRYESICLFKLTRCNEQVWKRVRS